MGNGPSDYWFTLDVETKLPSYPETDFDDINSDLNQSTKLKQTRTLYFVSDNPKVFKYCIGISPTDPWYTLYSDVHIDSYPSADFSSLTSTLNQSPNLKIKGKLYIDEGNNNILRYTLGSTPGHNWFAIKRDDTYLVTPS